MDIVTAAQFDKDISAKLPELNVKCGFEAEFASCISQRLISGALAHFLAHPDATEIDDSITATSNSFKVSTSYIASGKGKSYTTWSIESDPTVPTDHVHNTKVELVSPVLSLPDMLKGMKSVFSMMRATYKGTHQSGDGARLNGEFPLAMTSKSTGLHLTFSIKGTKARSVDVLKLAVLVGESYWATYMGRDQHSYATEALRRFDNGIVSAYHTDFSKLGMTLNSFAVAYVDAYFAARGYIAAPQNTPEQLLNSADLLYRSLHTSDAKYHSVNTQKADKGLLEFRLPGGEGYEHKYDKISVMAERFAYAFFAASDNSTYFDYYKNKLIRRALKVLNKAQDLNAKKATFSIDELLPKIIVAEGHTLLALTHPTSGKVYVAWCLTEVGDNAYKIANPSQLEYVTISRVDRGSGRTNTRFEQIGTEPTDFALYSEDSKHLIKDVDSVPMYPSKYTTPKKVRDVRGSEVTVVSEGSKESMFFEERATLLALSADAIAEMDPGVAAIVKETQNKVGPDNADELALLFNEATVAEVIALQSRYKDMILDAVHRSPTKSAKLLVDPLTPGVIDLAYSAGNRFNPEDAAAALSAPGFMGYAQASGVAEAVSADSIISLLGKFPKLLVHYRLIQYLINTSGGRSASYVMPSFNDMDASQTDFFLQTIQNLPQRVQGVLISALIDYLDSYHTGLGMLLDTHASTIIALTSSLPDIAEPVTDLNGHLPLGQNASLLSVLASRKFTSTTSVSAPLRRILDTMESRWPNMYASYDIVVAQGQVNAALNKTDILAVETAFSSRPVLNDMALSYLANEAISRSAGKETRELNIPVLTQLLYRAVFSGLLDIASLPDWAKGSSAVLIASQEVLHSRKELSEETPDAVLSILPGFKAQLYRGFISSPTGFGPRKAGNIAGFGASSRGMDALGEGSASFYAAMQKRSNTWNIQSVSAFVSGLYDMMPAALHVTPPPPSVLFDLIAQDVSKFSTEQPSDPEVADLQRRFASYVRATKGKAKVKVAPLAIDYPTITAPVFTEIQGAFPADWPEQHIFTPKQLASVFGSDTGEAVNSSLYGQFKKVDLLTAHLVAYSVDQLVELFSCPAIAAKTDSFGISIIRSLGAETSSGYRIMGKVNTNILLAVDRIGGELATDILVMYWKYSTLFPTSSSYFFAPDDTSNDFDVRDYFIRLAAGSATRVVTDNIDIASDSIESITRLSMRSTSFASKDLVAFYKFLVKNKFVGHDIARNLTYLLKAYLVDYKSPGYRVALIDALFAEADKKDRVFGLPTSINATYGYPDMER